MSEIRDNFIKSLDDSQCGITYKMEKVYSTLKEKDVELYMKLVRNIVPQWPSNKVLGSLGVCVWEASLMKGSSIIALSGISSYIHKKDQLLSEAPAPLKLSGIDTRGWMSCNERGNW